MTAIADINPPDILDCPADIIVSLRDRSSTEITAAWRQPIATDDSGDIPSVEMSHTPGLLFSTGSTTVTYTFQDSAENEAVCEFNVIVEGRWTGYILLFLYLCEMSTITRATHLY